MSSTLNNLQSMDPVQGIPSSSDKVLDSWQAQHDLTEMSSQSIVTNVGPILTEGDRLQRVNFADMPTAEIPFFPVLPYLPGSSFRHVLPLGPTKHTTSFSRRTKGVEPSAKGEMLSKQMPEDLVNDVAAIRLPKNNAAHLVDEGASHVNTNELEGSSNLASLPQQDAQEDHHQRKSETSSRQNMHDKRGSDANVFRIDQGRLAAFERERWSQWVVKATEEERRRRIEENKIEEIRERHNRQEWARKATLIEQRRIAQERAIASMKDTPWFQKMTSSYQDDYIVVCPNSYLGCYHSCPRSQVVQHMKLCNFSGERRQESSKSESAYGSWEASTLKDRDWIVVCPYSSFGCDHNCKFSELNSHMKICRYRGISRSEEEELRRQSTTEAVRAAEEERERRIAETTTLNGAADRESLLMEVLRSQTLSFQSILGQEISKFGEHCDRVFKRREAKYKKAIKYIRDSVNEIWPDASVVPYGSYASGLMTPESDIDLVVCMPGDLSWRSSSYEWMSELVSKLSSCSHVSDMKAIEGAVMPVVKLTVTFGGLPIPIDITFNGALHYGIASAAFVKKLVEELPSVGPVTQVLKIFLRNHGLSDPYTGGMPAYGIVLIVTAIALQLREQHRREQRRLRTIQELVEPITNNQKDPQGFGKTLEQEMTRRSDQQDEAATVFESKNTEERERALCLVASAKRPQKLTADQAKADINAGQESGESEFEKLLESRDDYPQEVLSSKITNTEKMPKSNLSETSKYSFGPRNTSAKTTPTRIPEGVYVSRKNTDVDLSIKANPPSPMRRHSRTRSGGGRIGQPFWDPCSQRQFGAQCGLEIAYPYTLRKQNISIVANSSLVDVQFPSLEHACDAKLNLEKDRTSSQEVKDTINTYNRRNNKKGDVEDFAVPRIRRVHTTRMDAGCQKEISEEDVEGVLKEASTMDQALGCLLMDAMHFVSNSFNFQDHTLSVMNGGCAYPRQGGSSAEAVIEDPLRRVNNVGRSCFRFKELQNVLGEALISLSSGIVRSESQTHKINDSVRTVLGLNMSDETDD